MAVNLSRTFLLRKLHQVTGIAPLGIFFFGHMFTNSKSMSGDKVFNDAVGDIHHIPYLLFVEIFGIFLPLLFHSVYGMMISAEAKPNVGNYSYGRNWFYIFQRVTGVFLFFFIIFHLLNLRFGAIPGLPSYGNPVAGNADKAFAIVQAEFKNIAIMIFYILGVIATAWHLAYGFFLFAVDWGIVIGEKAQKYALKGAIGIAVMLSAVGINAAVAFVRPCGLFPQAFCGELEKNKIVEPDNKGKF